MFFRRPRPKVPSFSERIDILAKAGFGTEKLPDRRVRVSKHGVAAIIGDEDKNQPDIERAGLRITGEIATLLNRGYQMFWETPSGKRFPATAEQLHALRDFEADVKEALDLTDLYNTSLGTTTRNHMYDRVFKRDQGQQPKPWVRKDHSITPPHTKADTYPA